MELVVEMYDVTASFPVQEQYGLVSQIRRASVSVPANIAEGWGRHSKKANALFLRYSRGSTLELETLILLSARLDLIQEGRSRQVLQRIETISKMLNVTLQKLER